MNPAKPIVLSIQSLLADAPSRLPGYFEECLRRGQQDGDALFLTPSDWQYIRNNFNPAKANTPPAKGCCGQ